MFLQNLCEIPEYTAVISQKAGRALQVHHKLKCFYPEHLRFARLHALNEALEMGQKGLYQYEKSIYRRKVCVRYRIKLMGTSAK
jgi:hypothetical protein